MPGEVVARLKVERDAAEGERDDAHAAARDFAGCAARDAELCESATNCGLKPGGACDCTSR